VERATHRRSDATTPPPAIIASVTNTGKMAGDTHVMVFLKSPAAAATAITSAFSSVPPKQVFVHFERVAGLAPGETRKVRVEIPHSPAWRLAMDTLVGGGAGEQGLRVEVGDVVSPAVLELLVV
jgi:hypothetical protein